MPTRFVKSEVVFRRPFVLDGFERVEPAGTYTVESEEESLDAVSFLAWKRLATVMHLTHDGTTEYVRIDPQDLRKAEARDAAQEPQADAGAQLEAYRRHNAQHLARRKKF